MTTLIFRTDQDILFGAWREACRHIRIEESVAAVGPPILERLAARRLIVRRFDLARSVVETVGGAGVVGERPWEAVRNECRPEEMKRLLAWCRAGGLLDSHQGDPESLLPLASPGEGRPRTIVGPLVDSLGPVGVLVVATASDGPLPEADRELLVALLESFGIALENDRRIRELAALREAAEADRSSLLTRLGRRGLADTIVGEDSGLQGAMDRVELVARSDVPVLIFGETGTGKELVARAIHSRSARSAGPFLRVNCGAIPPELVDSQLFGHERGSFTGASDTHRGWFERADRGTLFLDEIGELPPAAQVRLLRVLQDGVFERVGAQQPTTVDVRVVAATHRELSVMVREGRFREDLWYRLAVFPIDLPPLRDRVDDVPALARHFAQRAATRFGLPLQLPSADDIGMLVSYRWPGNVRELAAVMDRAAILGEGRRLEVAGALGVQTAAARTGPRPPEASFGEPIETLDAAMRRHIEKALAAAHGRIEGPRGAAQILDINPHTLRARMRKLGIAWQRFRAGLPDAEPALQKNAAGPGDGPRP